MDWSPEMTFICRSLKIFRTRSWTVHRWIYSWLDSGAREEILLLCNKIITNFHSLDVNVLLFVFFQDLSETERSMYRFDVNTFFFLAEAWRIEFKNTCWTLSFRKQLYVYNCTLRQLIDHTSVGSFLSSYFIFHWYYVFQLHFYTWMKFVKYYRLCPLTIISSVTICVINTTVYIQ